MAMHPMQTLIQQMSVKADQKKRRLQCLIKYQHLLKTSGCGSAKCKNKECVSSGNFETLNQDAAFKASVEFAQKNQDFVPKILNSHTIYSLVKNSAVPLYDLLLPALRTVLADPKKLANSFKETCPTKASGSGAISVDKDEVEDCFSLLYDLNNPDVDNAIFESLELLSADLAEMVRKKAKGSEAKHKLLNCAVIFMLNPRLQDPEYAGGCFAQLCNTVGSLKTSLKVNLVQYISTIPSDTITNFIYNTQQVIAIGMALREDEEAPLHKTAAVTDGVTCLEMLYGAVIYRSQHTIHTLLGELSLTNVGAGKTGLIEEITSEGVISDVISVSASEVSRGDVTSDVSPGPGDGLISVAASEVSPGDRVISENGSSSPRLPSADAVSLEHVVTSPLPWLPQEEPSDPHNTPDSDPHNTPDSEPQSKSASKPDSDIPSLTNSDKDGSSSDISRKTSDSIPLNGAEKPSSLTIKQTSSENGLNSGSDLPSGESGELTDSTAPRDVLLSSHSGPLTNGSVNENSAPEGSRSEINVPETSGSNNSDTSSSGLKSSSETSGSKINDTCSGGLKSSLDTSGSKIIDTSSGYANTSASSREGEASCSLESSRQDNSYEALVSSTSADTNMRSESQGSDSENLLELPRELLPLLAGLGNELDSDDDEEEEGGATPHPDNTPEDGSGVRLMDIARDLPPDTDEEEEDSSGEEDPLSGFFRMHLTGLLGGGSRANKKAPSSKLFTKLGIDPPWDSHTQIDLSLFYNDDISGELKIDGDYFNYKSGKGFAFLHYPYVLRPHVKSIGLQFENRINMTRSVNPLTIYISGGLPYLKLMVKRENVVQDALTHLEMVAEEAPGHLQRQLYVEFEGEEGVDEGGVSKEFFQLVIAELFNPDYGMFLEIEDTRMWWFNPQSFEVEHEYKLIGMLLGLAVYNTVILDIRFPTVLYQKLIGERPSILDLLQSHPTLGNSLQQLLDYPGEDVEEVFMMDFSVSTAGLFGETITHNLVPNGNQVPVTNDNRHDFVERYVNYILNESVSKQFDQFKKGFDMVTAHSPLKTWFRPEELEKLIVGTVKLDFTALEGVARYDGGYSADSDVVKWFWEVVHGMSDEEKSKLLAFSTGCGRAPVGGMAELNFIVVKNGGDSERLPTAHTCFNVLLLPEYSSQEKLKIKLFTAIQHFEGFGMI